MNKLKSALPFFIVTMMLSTGTQSADSMSGMTGADHGSMKEMASPSAQPIAGAGLVRKTDAAKHKVTLSHEAIAALGWPPMTMDFAVAPEIDLASLQAGQSVSFSLLPTGQGQYMIVKIKPAGK